MKSVELSGVRAAEQLVVGMSMDKKEVTLALESPLGGWLVQHSSPEQTREVARTLLDAADIAEGKLADNGQYDANAADFREHHGR